MSLRIDGDRSEIHCSKTVLHFLQAEVVAKFDGIGSGD